MARNCEGDEKKKIYIKKKHHYEISFCEIHIYLHTSRLGGDKKKTRDERWKNNNNMAKASQFRVND